MAKVIGHYRLLLVSAKTEKERELYRSRIESDQRLLDELRDGFSIGSRRDLPGARRPLRGIRYRAEAAWSGQVEVVCSQDRRACAHVRFGLQSRWSEIQGGARAVSPALRECLTRCQIAA